MLRLSAWIKVAVFAVLAVAVLAYTGIHYANIGQYFGSPGYYTVNVDLAQAGGLYTDADVTYRGVTVGRVGSLTLSGSGVRARLDINDSAPKIPADTRAVVADLSAIGEQYLNLVPGTSAGPYLAADDTISEANTQIPQPVTNLLQNVNALATSLPASSLQTVVNELYNGFNGQGQNLQRLLDATSGFTRAASGSITPTTNLISSGKTVLQTQEADSAEIESFAASIDQLATQLQSSDPDIRSLIKEGTLGTRELLELLKETDPNLGLTLANLLTLSDVASTRQPALDELLSVLPAVTAAGDTVVTKDGANFGLTLTFFNPLPCTSGYQATPHRLGTDITGKAPALNTSAACTSPASSGIDVRGSAHAPSGGAVPAAVTP